MTTTDSRRYEQPSPPGLIEAFIGIVVEPRSTIESLLAENRPRHGFLFMLLFLATLFVPIIAQGFKYEYLMQSYRVLAAIGAAVIGGFILFMIFQSWLLILIRVEATPAVFFASLTYPLVPFTVALWCIYAANYFASGSLTLISLMLSGYGEPGDLFLQSIPYALVLTLLMCSVVYYHCIKTIAEMHPFTAFFTTIFTLLPLFGAVALGLTMANLIRPGFMAVILMALSEPVELLNAPRPW